MPPLFFVKNDCVASDIQSTTNFLNITWMVSKAGFSLLKICVVHSVCDKIYLWGVYRAKIVSEEHEKGLKDAINNVESMQALLKLLFE